MATSSSSDGSPTAGRRSSTRRSRASGSRTRTRRESSTTAATSPTSTTRAPSTTAISRMPRSRRPKATSSCARSHVEYHAPARFDDLIEAFVRVRRIGRTSMTYECAAYRLPDDELMVTAEHDCRARGPATTQAGADPRSDPRGVQGLRRCGSGDVSTRLLLEALERILERGGEPDDVLRGGYGGSWPTTPTVAWAGIAFLEEGDLVLGPAAGEPDETRRITGSDHVPGRAGGRALGRRRRRPSAPRAGRRSHLRPCPDRLGHAEARAGSRDSSTKEKRKRRAPIRRQARGPLPSPHSFLVLTPSGDAIPRRSEAPRTGDGPPPFRVGVERVSTPRRRDEVEPLKTNPTCAVRRRRLRRPTIH